jgi:hypothetical protein
VALRGADGGRRPRRKRWRRLNCAHRLAVAKARLDPDIAEYRRACARGSARPGEELDRVLDELHNRPFLIPSL